MFLDALEEALGNVRDVYYGNGRWIPAEHPNLNARESAQLTRFITRHLQRTFCYELCHQLRQVLPDPDEAGGPVLQAELSKAVIPEWLAERWDFQALRSSYFPDLFYHQPFSPDHQVAVVEVKAKPNVEGPELTTDINKLGKFVERYRYGLAIMLFINSDLDRTYRLIRNNQNRIQREVNPDQIVVICKLDSWSPTTIVQLSQLQNE